jgi:CheY-like chemotaxis protein
MSHRMPADSSSPLVLLVEDSDDLREALEDFLMSRGYRVIARDSVEGSLEAMRANAPDLVLTDIFLGQSSGLDLITTIRSDFPAPPPIIACSGMPEVGDEALSRGAALFLRKPLVPQTLEQAVSTLLDQRMPSRELLEEHEGRSQSLRAHNIEAAREMLAEIEPFRALLDQQAERDVRWLPAFLGLGNAIVAMIDGERLVVNASTDPKRWPHGSDIESSLPLCRHIIETGSTFLVPDLASMAPRTAATDDALRFVAGFPVTFRGVPIGVLCLVGDQPGRLDPADFSLLEEFCRYYSDWLSDDARPTPRGAQLMKRKALEAVLRAEFDRAARRDLTVHLFTFSSHTPPPDLIAERTLVAELGPGRFGLIITRSSDDRSPAELVAAVRRLSAVPGYGGGDLVSIEARSAPRLDDFILHFAERRLDERAASHEPPNVHRVVVRHEALDSVA